jgi:thymidylate synthase (methanogen type)
MLIQKENTMDAWLDALLLAKNSNTRFIDENNNECQEILGMMITINNSGTINEPLIAMRSMGPWHYPSNDELTQVIMHPHKSGLPYTYGSRIFSYNDFNQVEDFIIPLLQKEPNSRRAVITLWNPANDSNPRNRSVPGLISLDFKLRNGKLSVSGMIRSADLLFGWPANIYQISLIQQRISKKLNTNNGTITTFMTSAHIFTYQHEHIDELIRLYR